ncbi:MAG: hypothetical protein LBS77_06045, partial [Desulfovibrio sp.]|nr:hypothetical protein [Desulfovibrio sp.]
KEDQRLEQFKLLAESAEGWRIYSNRFERFSVFRHPALPGVFDCIGHFRLYRSILSFKNAQR